MWSLKTGDNLIEKQYWDHNYWSLRTVGLLKEVLLYLSIYVFLCVCVGVRVCMVQIAIYTSPCCLSCQQFTIVITTVVAAISVAACEIRI